MSLKYPPGRIHNPDAGKVKMTTKRDEKGSWSLGVILRHGLGDFAIEKKGADEFFSADLPFNIEGACRELDAERDRWREMAGKMAQELKTLSRSIHCGQEVVDLLKEYEKMGEK